MSKALNYLGIARKSGGIETGEDNSSGLVKAGAYAFAQAVCHLLAERNIEIAVYPERRHPYWSLFRLFLHWRTYIILHSERVRTQLNLQDRKV